MMVVHWVPFISLGETAIVHRGAYGSPQDRTAPSASRHTARRAMLANIAAAAAVARRWPTESGAEDFVFGLRRWNSLKIVRPSGQPQVVESEED